MNKLEIKNYFFKLSKNKFFIGIAIAITIFKMLPSLFCNTYNTLFGKIVMLLFAIWVSYNNITAGIFAIALLILIHEKCYNIIKEGFNQDEDMSQIKNPDDFRKRICVSGNSEIVMFDMSGNKTSTSDPEWLFTDKLNNFDFYKNVFHPFWTGKNSNGTMIDLNSFTKENGCDVDAKGGTFSAIANFCGPKCEWKTKKVDPNGF